MNKEQLEAELLTWKRIRSDTSYISDLCSRRVTELEAELIKLKMLELKK